MSYCIIFIILAHIHAYIPHHNKRTQMHVATLLSEFRSRRISRNHCRFKSLKRRVRKISTNMVYFYPGNLIINGGKKNSGSCSFSDDAFNDLVCDLMESFVVVPQFCANFSLTKNHVQHFRYVNDLTKFRTLQHMIMHMI